ncbi:MAG: HigA family addiction module antidote protein [Rhodospirillales bacterium]|nr:HigA family addiction module antidote protein [Rhodospirillales bacterium]
MTAIRIGTHPGEILREAFMIPLGLSANALARALGVPPNRITAIVAADNPRAVTPDTALRLARYFGTTPELWLNLQLAYDLSAAIAHRGARIEAAVQPRAA